MQRQDHGGDKNRTDFAAYQSRHDAGTALIYLAVNEDGQRTGFLEAELWSDYVEGLYVVHRQPDRGVVAGLVDTLAAHALSEGYITIASDCELDNETSEAFHRSIDFKEVIRSIHFIKPLI